METANALSDSTDSRTGEITEVIPMGEPAGAMGEMANSAGDAQSVAEPVVAVEEAKRWEAREHLLAILVVLAIFYTIYFTRSVLFPITLAILLNLVFKPIILKMERLRIPSPVSAGLVLIAFGLVVATMTTALWEPASRRIQEFTAPGYFNRMAENLKPLKEPLENIEKASEKVSEMTRTEGKADPVRVQIDEPQLGSVLNLTGGFVGGALVVLVLLYFLLAAGDRFLEKLVEAAPTFQEKRRVVELTRAVQSQMSDYLFTITAINILLGATIGFGLWAIDLPNPVLWGVVAALLNYIPFAGAAIGAFLVFMEGLASFSSLGHAALAPAIYIGVNTIEANFVTPAMLGKSISLNPVMIVVSLVFWGWLWGIGGVLLAVPLLVVIKIFFDHSKRFAPLGSILGR